MPRSTPAGRLRRRTIIPFATIGFWLALVPYLLICITIDLLALRLNWWSFPKEKVIGAFVCGVPAEEFILFLLFYAAILAAWETDLNDGQ